MVAGDGDVIKLPALARFLRRDGTWETIIGTSLPLDTPYFPIPFSTI